MKKTVFKILIGLAAAAFLVMSFGCEMDNDNGDDEGMQLTIDSVEPNFFIFGEQVEITLTGTNFTEDIKGTLVNGSTIIDYTGETILTSTQMIMFFGEAWDTAGWYDLILINASGEELVLPEAVEFAEFRIIKQLTSATISIPLDTPKGFDFSAEAEVDFDGGSADAYFIQNADDVTFQADLDSQGQAGTYYYDQGGDWGSLEYAEGIAILGDYAAVNHVIYADQHFGTVDVNTGYYIVFFISNIDTGAETLSFDYIIVEKNNN